MIQRQPELQTKLVRGMTTQDLLDLRKDLVVEPVQISDLADDFSENLEKAMFVIEVAAEAATAPKPRKTVTTYEKQQKQALMALYGVRRGKQYKVVKPQTGRVI